MKKETTQTIVIIIIVLLMCFADNLMAQNVVRDAAGNFTAFRKIANDTSTAILTGQKFTDAKGIVYPVYESQKGKLFVRKISKNGNGYNYYLKEK